MSQTKTQLVEGLNINTSAPADALAVANDGDVGIGITSPNYKLHLHSATTGDSNYLQITHADAGSGASDGLQLGLATGSSPDAYLAQKENGALIFQTNAQNRARIDSSGRLLVGTSTARTNFDNGSITSNLFQIERTASAGNAALSVCANATDATVGSVLYMGRTRATADGGTTVVQSGDLLGRLTFQGADGSEIVEAAKITGEVDGTPGSNDMPGRLVFSTTADGASSPTERMRLTNDGYLRFGNGNSYYHTIRAAGGNNPFEFTANAGQQNAESIGRFAFNTSSFGGAITTRVDIQNQGLFRVFTTAEQCARFSTTLSASTSTYLIDGRYSASGLGTGTLAFIIYTNGNIANVNNSYTGFSDVKLKENIVDATSQWDDIKAIKIRKYNFKEETGYSTHTQLGVVAQELELVSPGLVIESPERKPTQIPVLDENGDAILDENGDPTFNTEDRETGEVIKSVNYSVLYMKAVKALQEAISKIETLEAANASQAATIAAFEARLTALEGAG